MYNEILSHQKRSHVRFIKTNIFSGNKHKEKLSLNFESGSGGSGSSKGLHLNLGPIAPPRDLVDASLPLDRQGYVFFL